MFRELSMSATTIDLDAVRLAARPARAAREPRADDGVVQWFIDYYWIRHALPDNTLDAWRSDLLALERWLGLARNRTLLTAGGGDLREFFDSRYRAGASAIRDLPSLTCIRRFYFYLVEAGFRADDPTENVYVRTPRLGGRDLANVPGGTG
jgi:integrase/recombinase XerD